MNVEWLLFLPEDQGKPHWEKVILEKNSKGGERTNHADVWGKSVPGREGEWKRLQSRGMLDLFTKQQGGQCRFSYIVNEDRRNRVRVLVMRRSRTLF